MTKPVVFISYSHQDEQEKETLLSHLGVLKGAGLIDLWSDDRIGAGKDWQQEIDQAMAQAHVAILLISANFLNSDFILRREVPVLLKRRQGEGLAVFPIIAKACAWRSVGWLAKMNVKPKNGRPVWGDGGCHVDEDLAAIAEEVTTIVKTLDITTKLGDGVENKQMARQHKKQSSVKRYKLDNIRTLLTAGFTDRQLRRFCFDTTDFRPVHDQLAQNTGRDEIVDLILDHADRILKIEIVLDWARQHNPARYESHKPYYEFNLSDVRILLVDDNEHWREQLGGLLEEKFGYQVVTAVSKDDAIQHIKNDEPYHLAVIDMRLDEADENNRAGVELGFWLRDNEFENLPIIIMTAYDMESEIARNVSLRPFQFSVVEKGKIGSGDFTDLLRQVELAIQ
jgi:CheY-like chemotaxis protein